MKKMILFDIDGTLLYTGGAGRIAFEKVFEEMFKVPHCWGDLDPSGKTDPWIIEEITQRTLSRTLKENEYTELVDRYHACFEKEIVRSESFRIFAGVAALLNRLSRRDDFLLGVATGNFEIAAWLKLKRGDLDNHFRFGGFGSDAADRVGLTAKGIERGIRFAGKNFEREDILVIGDTPFDIQAGKKLNCRTLGVATGRLSALELLEHGPDQVVENFEETSAVVELIDTIFDTVPDPS